MADEKRCSGCDHSAKIDFGYSNYTTEGTTIVCMLKLHPLAEFDRWYGENDDDAFAETCVSFEPGSGLNLDVERLDYDELSDEHKAWLNGERGDRYPAPDEARS